MKDIKYKINVIVCGPAVGKTYLAEHDKRFIDLDDMKATYKYGLDNLSRREKENGKLNRNGIVNKDSTQYAIKILEKEIANNHIVLISSDSKNLLKYIIDKKINYCLVYANINSKEEYIERMKKRGNNDIFIKKLTETEIWKKSYKKNKTDSNSKYKIELKQGQYLSDFKDYFIDND